MYVQLSSCTLPLLELVPSTSTTSKRSGSEGLTINVRIGEVRAVASEMASASTAQTAQVKSIATAINRINDVTQQNAAMAEKSTAAATELCQQAEDLEQLVGSFELGAAAPDPQEHARASFASAIRGRSSVGRSFVEA